MKSVRSLLERALRDTGLRKPLKPGVKRHEFKASHGFRKFYDTYAKEARMLGNYVEQTIGYTLGVAQNYDRPTEEMILAEYLKAVPALTINDESSILSKELSELKKSNKADSHVVKTRLEEKDSQIASLDKQVDELRAKVDWYLDSIGIAKKIVARSHEGMIDEDRSILDDQRRFTVSYIDNTGKRKTVKVPIDNVEIFDGRQKIICKSRKRQPKWVLSSLRRFSSLFSNCKLSSDKNVVELSSYFGSLLKMVLTRPISELALSLISCSISSYTLGINGRRL